METANRKEIDNLLKELGQTCDTGFAFALHIRFTRPNILYRTYPEPWIEEYSEKGMMMDDPVVLWGMQHEGIVRWEDLDDPKGVLEGAKAHGLRNGLTCAVLENGSRSISGFTRSTQPFSEAEAQELLEMTRQLHNLTAGLSDL